jgi:RND family efflux transporter MFP subunit
MKKIYRSRKFRNIFLFIVLFGIFWVLFLREKNITVLVSSVDVEDRIVTRSLSSNGYIKSKSSASLSFVSTGRIAKILVQENEPVTKGQLLAYLDTTTQQNTIQYYKDARDIAIKDRELFIDQKTANTATLGGDKRYNIKLNEYDEALSQAEAYYQAQVSVLTNMYIRAPFDGVVTSITKSENETATAGDVVINVNDLTTLQFEVSVDQNDYGLIKVNQEVIVEIDSYTGYKLPGKVIAVPLFSNALDEFDVDVNVVSDEAHPLRIGMKGDASIILDSTVDKVKSLTVDVISYDESDNPFVWVIRNNKIYKQPVTIGLEGDIFVELKSELTDPVVISAKDGQKMLDGYKAKIINK